MLKFIARKPVAKTKTYLEFGVVITEQEFLYCPKCMSVLNAGPNYQPHYCEQCGQKIDFSKVTWKANRQIGLAERVEVL